MTRRRFAFWIGMGLFWISRKTRADVIDNAASVIMRGTEPASGKSVERWKPGENSQWRWYERQQLIRGKWVTTGITTPVNKHTSRPYEEKAGYLDESLVPPITAKSDETQEKYTEPIADATRRAQGGRPPSRWLRSLNADELKIWLRTINVPEVGVDGMTFWTHLTRDHSFSAERIQGLSLANQAKLHSAAHFGY